MDTTEWPSYLSALLHAPGASPEYEIGSRVNALTDDEQRRAYLAGVKRDNASGTRRREIAEEIDTLRGDFATA